MAILAGWGGKAPVYLGPVINRLAEDLRQPGRGFTDAPSVPVLNL